jgi:hypothetical protein
MYFNLPSLIGITGLAGSGKDTLADYLVRQQGFAKYMMAARMKAALAKRFNVPLDYFEDRQLKEEGHDRFGYRAGESEYFSIRSWAQWLGTEFGRDMFGEDCWVELMEQEWRRNTHPTLEGTHSPFRMVVSDVRFDNEARRIQYLGGVVIRVVRPSVKPVNAHVSEAGVSDQYVNVEVVNSVDIVSYLQRAVGALEDCPRGV